MQKVNVLGPTCEPWPAGTLYSASRQLLAVGEGRAGAGLTAAGAPLAVYTAVAGHTVTLEPVRLVFACTSVLADPLLTCLNFLQTHTY